MGRCLCVLLAASFLGSQPLPPETILIGRARYHMMETLRRIPNYTCLETIERSIRKPGSKRVSLVDAIRLEVAVVDGKELFSWPGERQFKERDLHELAPGGAMGNGNFALHARSVFGGNSVRFTYIGKEAKDGRQVARFNYSVSEQFSGYQIRVGDAAAIVPYHGQVMIDATTLDLIELEVIADDVPPALMLARATDKMHYTRQRIGESDFLLPVSSQMAMIGTNGSESHNKVSFTGCRQYTGESVVRFDDPEPSTAAAPVAELPRMPTEMPADLLIEAQLDAPFSIADAATGDPLTFTVRSDARRKKTVYIPKGAKLRARVGDVDRKAGYRAFTAGIGIQVVEVEHNGQIVPLKAVVDEGGSVSTRNSLYALVPAQQQRPAMVYVKSLPPRLPKGLLLQLRVLP